MIDITGILKYNISYGVRYIAGGVIMDYNSLAADLFSSLVKSSNAPFQKEPRDFSMGEMGILVYLNFICDGVSSGELSDRLEVSTGRVAAALNTLEKKKMIERNRDFGDRRRVIVNITESGKRTVLKKHSHGVSCVEEILKNLGENDAKEFVRIMEKIIKSL